MKVHPVVLLALCLHTPRLLVSTSEHCEDWGVGTTKHKLVYSGEPAKIKCPILETSLKYNQTTAHSARLTLIWYWIGQGQDLEEPINFRHPDNRISKEKDTLWFRPALVNDTGNYTCMLRNTTYCSKFAVPLEVVSKEPGSCISQVVKPEDVLMYSGRVKQNLTCPDVESFYSAGIQPAVRWYMNCNLMKFQYFDRIPNGLNLTFGIVSETYDGEYTCVASYQENGREFALTRTLRVKVVGSPEKSTPPVIISPTERIIYELKPGDELFLHCEVTFTFLKDSPQDVWWAVDGGPPQDIPEFKFNISYVETPLPIGGTAIQRSLIVPRVTKLDLKRNYTCFASNNKGTVHVQAIVRMKPPVTRYTLELACGLGATVLLVVLLTVVYHVYWLELVLFYRAHFGTDETILDGKEYDVYVSYARNTEEEDFVLLTLRGVLENEYGYKLCIFDRDSLPGGIVTDETLSFIQRSRRLLVLLSPNYVLRGTQALLEFKAGLENMASKGTIKVILVQYKPIKKSKVKELRRAKTVLTVIKWKGEKSRYPRGRFWKELLVELPVKSKPKSLVDITEAIFDFIQKSRKMIVVLSPDYLLEKSISLLEFKLGLLCQNNIATKLVVVEYQPLPRAHPSIQQLKESVAFVAWKGEKSKHVGSKFWKALRLALPLQSLTTCGNAAWNESCSSHSDTSLDHAQKKRSRLKGPAPRPKDVPVQRGLALLPGRKAKQPPKPFLACRCCVAYCNESRKLGSPGPAVPKPTQEMQCQRLLLGDPAGLPLQNNGNLQPLGSQVAALGLQRFADVSNNNDFYVL